MARITVEDCLEKIDSQYDLVLLAKERTAQLNAGEPSMVPVDNDKNTVISLREIGEGKVSVKSLEDSAIGKLQKQQETSSDLEDLGDDDEDDFDKIYKGEISKSGTAVLPSKRVRRIPEKINVISKNSVTEEEENKVEENESEAKEELVKESLDTNKTE